MKRFFTYTTIAATLTLWAGAAQAAPSGEVVPPHPVQTIQQFLQREELQEERERQAQLEAERQAQAERERQAQLEAERQAQAERERQAQLEAERQAQAERERQAQLEAERQAQEAAESTEEAPEAESAPTLTAAPSEPAQPLQIGSPLPEPPALQEKPALKVALASGQEGELWTMYARLGRTGSQGDAQLRQSLERLSQDHPAAHEDLYLRAWRARIAAKGALAFKNDSSLSQSLAAAAQRDLQFIGPWLERYKEMVTIHGYREPAWIGGRVDAASQAVLALCDLQALHPQADLIVLWHGTNDWYWGAPLGAPKDTCPETYCGALRQAVAALRCISPRANIVSMTPLPRWQEPDGIPASPAPRAGYFVRNRAGHTLAEYEAALLSCSRELCFPVIDLRTLMNLHPGNASLYLKDGIHPNRRGYEVLTRIASAQIRLWYES